MKAADRKVNFNRSFIPHFIVGVLQMMVGVKFLVTQEGQGLVSGAITGISAIVAGILLFLLGFALALMPFFFKWKRTQVKIAIDTAIIFSVIFIVEMIASFYK